MLIKYLILLSLYLLLKVLVLYVFGFQLITNFSIGVITFFFIMIAYSIVHKYISTLNKDLNEEDRYKKPEEDAVIIAAIVFVMFLSWTLPLFFLNELSQINRDEVKIEQVHETELIDGMSFAKVDKDSAFEMAKMKLSSMGTDYSIFYIDYDFFTKAIYKGELVRFAPMMKDRTIVNRKESADKILVAKLEDSLGRPQTEIVTLNKPMKYFARGFAGQNPITHIRKTYPTKRFKYLRFELDDEDNPYWVMNEYEENLLTGIRKINNVVVMDANSGDINIHKVGEGPSWLENQRPAKESLREYNYRTYFVNGAYLWNSKKNAREVDYHGGSYTYVRIDDKLYTMASVNLRSSDIDRQDSVGMVYMDLSDLSSIELQGGGVSLRKAMDVAKENNPKYDISVPHFTKIDGTPVYISMLKDKNKVTAGYSIIAFDNYLVAGSGTNMNEAINKLKISSSGQEVDNSSNLSSQEVTIKELRKTMINGTELFFMKFDKIDGIYKTDASTSNYVPFLEEGLKVNVDTKGDMVIFIKIVDSDE